MAYKQQGVVQLRPSDMIRVVQNGQDELLLIQSVIDSIRSMIGNAMDGPIVDFQGQVDGIQAEIDTVWTAINAANTAIAAINQPKTVKATVTAGNAVFQFTVDGTPTGAALFPNSMVANAEQFRAEEGTNPHAFGAAVWSNGNKTLTVPVSRNGATLSVLGLTVLGANVAANGSVVYATAFGH